MYFPPAYRIFRFVLVCDQLLPDRHSLLFASFRVSLVIRLSSICLNVCFPVHTDNIFNTILKRVAGEGYHSSPYRLHAVILSVVVTFVCDGPTVIFVNLTIFSDTSILFISFQSLHLSTLSNLYNVRFCTMVMAFSNC